MNPINTLNAADGWFSSGDLGCFLSLCYSVRWRIYLLHTTRKKDGKVHRYRSLVRSVRVGRRVIQQTVAQLGEFDELRAPARALPQRLIGAPEQAPAVQGWRRSPDRSGAVEGHSDRAVLPIWLCVSGAALWRGSGLEELCERLLPSGKYRLASFARPKPSM